MATVIEILVLRDAFPSSVAVTFDVFATANRLKERAGRPAAFALRAIGSGAKRARAFMGGEDVEGRSKIIIVPGLGLNNEEELTARFAGRDVAWASQFLADAMQQGTMIAGACSAVFLLATSGILAGRRVTTSWWLAPLFQRLHPGVRLDAEALLVTDGPVMTAGAAMAQLDLSLAVVAHFAGPKLADACARYLLVDQRRSQGRYMSLRFLAMSDDHVARAETWARQRLSEPFSVGDLAAAVGLSQRTFARRVSRATGLSPVQLVQRLRVEQAVEALETTRLPFEEIARQVGYADPSTLRRIMKRDVGGGARMLRTR
jgi:transcriptional regulator GlxA family with amidase domain